MFKFKKKENKETQLASLRESLTNLTSYFRKHGIHCPNIQNFLKDQTATEIRKDFAGPEIADGFYKLYNIISNTIITKENELKERVEQLRRICDTKDMILSTIENCSSVLSKNVTDRLKYNVSLLDSHIDHHKRMCKMESTEALLTTKYTSPSTAATSSQGPAQSTKSQHEPARGARPIAPAKPQHIIDAIKAKGAEQARAASSQSEDAKPSADSWCARATSRPTASQQVMY